MDTQQVEIIVRGVLIDQGCLLLCQNRKHGHVFLPGGHVDFNEPATVALAREMIEELGLAVTIGKLLGTSESAFDQITKKGNAKRHHEINLIFEMSPDIDSTALREITSQEEHIQFIWRPLTQLEYEPIILPKGISKLITQATNAPNLNQDSWLSDMQG